MRPRTVFRSVLGALLLETSLAAAQGDDPAALAEGLFRSGRDLMAAGQYAEACPKFAESERVDPKPGTLMNLALCHEKLGKTASAWAEYLEAAEIARRAEQPDRERVAREHASTLEPSLAHVVVQSDAAPGTRIVLDDRVLGAGALGSPIPVDPGEHLLHASAGGKRPFSRPFTVAPASEAQTLRVPPLEAESAPSPPMPPPSPVAAPPPPGPNARLTWGLAVGGAGVALVGIGGFFGGRAFAEKHTADGECGGIYCTQTGLDAIAAMKTSEAVSTITIGAGLVAIGTGLYLVLTSGSRNVRTAFTLRLAPDVATRGVRAVVNW